MRNVLQVKVTNKNKFAIEDRYDGILYSMDAGKSVSIPYEAACHIFGVDFTPDNSGTMDPGLRDAAYRHVSRRWGLNRSAKSGGFDDKKAREVFDNIQFTLTTMVLVEQAVEEEVDLPAPHEIAANKGGRPRKEA